MTLYSYIFRPFSCKLLVNSLRKFSKQFGLVVAILFLFLTAIAAAAITTTYKYPKTTTVAKTATKSVTPAKTTTSPATQSVRQQSEVASEVGTQIQPSLITGTQACTGPARHPGWRAIIPFLPGEAYQLAMDVQNLGSPVKICTQIIGYVLDPVTLDRKIKYYPTNCSYQEVDQYSFRPSGNLIATFAQSYYHCANYENESGKPCRGAILVYSEDGTQPILPAGYYCSYAHEGMYNVGADVYDRYKGDHCLPLIFWPDG